MVRRGGKGRERKGEGQWQGAGAEVLRGENTFSLFNERQKPFIIVDAAYVQLTTLISSLQELS